MVSAFRETTNCPAGMVLDCVPVIPPDLRPMVQLDGGRFATSDLNDLYRRVINRNNRLKRLLDLGAPEIIVNNEKRMLQEAVDSLFDNGRRGRPVTGPGNRPLKSLSDMLKGKQGRFRQNLLGKRVDYSGRSVIVVGPQLKLHQCGLPKQMALELFKPFVMKRLVDLNHAQNIKSAKRMVERSRPVVWDVLEEVIAEHPVLLNRAPTLHRLGIQAFEPQLIEGKAIQIHPLVCTAFNADFDGDQMAVHLPLSAEAQAEARILMLSHATTSSSRPTAGRSRCRPRTWSSASTSSPWTRTASSARAACSPRSPRPRWPSSAHEITLQSKDQDPLPRPGAAGRRRDCPRAGSRVEPVLFDTTLGRALFNEALPADYAVRQPRGGQAPARHHRQRPGRALHQGRRRGVAGRAQGHRLLLGHPLRRHDLDRGRRHACRASRRSSATYEDQAAKVQKQFDRGLITDEERRQELIEIWTQATNEVAKEMEKTFEKTNPIYMMVHSGARGNMMQVRQIAAMRGLVANPRGEIIPRPIKANFREGLSVVEYFISTHGARKGLADTALRTADSGYLTRRLVDVSQDVIIREDDCGTERGLPKRIGAAARRRPAGRGRQRRDVGVRPHRRPPRSCTPSTGEVLVEAGGDIGDPKILELVDAGIETVKVRSVLTCDAKTGTCAKCYGRSLATGKLVDIGEAVGIIAAQSIGEPGTQLTMRTFHTGGVAGDDITHGLPRVVELFEARTPKGKAPITESAGRVQHRGDRQGPQDHRRPRRRRRGAGLPGQQALPPAGRGRRPRRGRPAADRTARPTRRTCCASSASARRRSTWSTRSRRSTAARACRSTTSTSRSSSGRCCAG